MKNRIVLLSSIGHTLFPPWYAQAFHPELTIASGARDGLGRWGLYGHSKMVSSGCWMLWAVLPDVSRRAGQVG